MQKHLENGLKNWGAYKAMIKCCKNCTPPKRFPGCGEHCPEYNTEKILDIAQKASAAKRKAIDVSIYRQKTNGIMRAIKRHGSNRKK